jgi:hypothetical protein
MDVLAALLPPVVAAVAFIAIVRAVIRHNDGRNPAESEDGPGDGAGGTE